jgi:hypothetical protein
MLRRLLWAPIIAIVLLAVTLGAHGRGGASLAQDAWNTTLIEPVADTYVSVESGPFPTRTPPATPRPNGGADHLSLGWNHLFGTDVTYMRFHLPTPAPDTYLVEAELQLGVGHVGLNPYSPPLPTTGTMRIEAQALVEPWGEALLAHHDLPEQAGTVAHGRFDWGPCPDPAGAGCGTARLDLFPLLGRFDVSDAARYGVALRAHPEGNDTPIFGWDLTVGSRESASPPQLRLVYRAVDLHQPERTYLPVLVHDF